MARRTLKRIGTLLAAAALMLSLLAGCAQNAPPAQSPAAEQMAEAAPGKERVLVVVDEEPDTVDFQCTTIFYTVALNVFNRLVEIQLNDDGETELVPALAESWTVSEDGLRYSFRLREGVRFSNGSALTSSDVLYTMTRLLTHPESGNRDIAAGIAGAKALRNGETDTLSGFEILSDRDFVITLSQPFAAFLPCLAMPGASILDRETTQAAGDRFGLESAWTIGTGSFVLESWEPGKGMFLRANPDCWEGLPGCDAIELRFLTDGEEERALFEQGELDILDLDELGDSAEYFIHGDIYQDRLYAARQIGISYIALNESVRPLNDVRVRKALQLSLDRQMLLDAIYSGRGEVENGIFPRGLKGYNPDLPEIPYDPDGARELLREAGYPDGFTLEVSVKSSSTMWEKRLLTMAASMWEAIGVRTNITVMSEGEFMRLRKTGALACYAATWSADYDDPDNFISTFFGGRENTSYRSLCYPREEIMQRVVLARAIIDEDARLAEYRELERIIVQEDAAWIPLFSRLHYYVAGERVAPFTPSWNGWVSTRYRYIALKEQ